MSGCPLTTWVNTILDQVRGGDVDPRHLRLGERVSTYHMVQHHLRPGEETAMWVHAILCLRPGEYKINVGLRHLRPGEGHRLLHRYTLANYYILYNYYLTLILI